MRVVVQAKLCGNRPQDEAVEAGPLTLSDARPTVALGSNTLGVTMQEPRSSAAVSRGEFIKGGVAVLGGAAMFGVAGATRAWASPPAANPKPIPGGLGTDFLPTPISPLFHVLPPSVEFEMSTITDFNGVIAAAEIQGTAHGSDGSQYTFDADMRFMHGRYIDADGRHRDKAFAFI